MLNVLCSVFQSSELGTRLSGLLEQYQHYQDEVGSLDSWLSTQEQNQSVFKPSGEQPDTQTLQHTLSTVQVGLFFLFWLKNLRKAHNFSRWIN